MASLGFRHAQFSEDSAWLPDWLQCNQVESPKEELLKKPGLYLEDRDEGKDTGKVNDGDNRFLLYWSGEGSSQISPAQPPGDVLRFHLYLSSYSNSPCRGSQIPSISPLLVQSLRNDESAPEPVELERARQCGGGVKVPNLEEEAAVRPDEIKQHQERGKVSDIKEAAVGHVEIDRGRKPDEGAEVAELRETEIYDAVELSIAASEAMIINELVEGDSDLGYLPMIAVVEMALRVKQARLEALKDMHHVPVSGTAEDCSSSSEMDDISIVDAFEDVGMSLNDDNYLGIRDTDISHVQETPVSRNYKDYDNGSECLLGNIGNVCPRNQSDVGVPVNNDNDLGRCDMDISHVQETPVNGYANGPVFLLENVDNLCPRNQSDGDLAQARELTKRCSPELTKESAQNQDSVSVYFAPDSAISDMSTHVHKVPHVAVGSMCNVSTEDKRSGSAVAGHTLDQPRCGVNLSYQDQVRDRQRCTTSRFQSRWFGGWTAKEVDAAGPIKQPIDRNIGKPFVGEMSSLSESADVAPDEMSAVQEHQSRRSDIDSQSNIPLGGSCRKADQGLPFSQEVARSSSQSSIDPLCSIVPCSLSAENPGSPQAQYRDDEYINAEKCSSPTSGPRVVKPYEISDPEIQCNQKVHPSTANDERSEGIVQRQLSSLKNYSMLLPRRLNGLDNRQLNFSILSPLECTRRTALSKMEMDTSRAYVRSSVSSLRTRLEFSVGQDNEKNRGSGTAEPSGEVAANRKSLDRLKVAAQVLPPLPTKRKSPGTLDRTKRCRIQVSSLANYSFSKDKQPIEPEAAVNIQESNILHNIQGHGSNPILDQPPREKKVRFAEAEIPRQVGRCRHKLKSSRKNGTQSRKRLGSCKQQLDPRGEGMQLLGRCNSDRKKFIFQGMEFIVTGFSSYKEKEIEGLIQRHGGNVLLDIPSAKFRRKRNSKVQPRKPIAIASKKSRTAKFLYGCAVKTLVLEVSWLTDSISAGKIKSPEKYMIISYQPDVTSFGITGESFPLSNSKFIFEHVGIMLHGKSSFFTKFASIIKHGGGQAFRTLQQLLQSLETKKVSVGAIATEFESTTSRHLRQCAMERNIPVMPASWMIESLYAGKLLPLI